jgi:penicillin-binding protein 2
MGLNSGWSEIPVLKKRFVLLSLAAAGVFLLLALRLWYLQVIAADLCLALSEKNRIRYVPIAAPRGPVYDRDGELLVDNRPSFDVSVLPSEVEDKEPLLTRLALYLGVESTELARRWDKGRRYSRYRPVPLAADVGRDVMEVIQENGVTLPGVLTEARPVRSYPYGESAAHLFGYLGEITDRELQDKAFSGYRLGEYVGKGGLEKALESYLHGSEGQRRVEVDVKGRELRLLNIQEPVPGARVFLTLQRDLQLAAEKAFADKSGAAVAIDVHTGEVLALVSRPGFDPSLFASGISGQQWIELLQNPRFPLQNKAIRGQYPPGSTFKVAVALAALKAGVASPATSVICEGKTTIGNREFRCWKKEGHGTTDLKKALKESCDVWFYKVGIDLGIDRLAAMVRELGLGEPLGIGLDGEKGGLIPDRAWKRRRFNVGWYDGESAIAAIGQGYVLTTPLQLATMTAALVNGGRVMQPYVVKRVEDQAGRVLFEPEPKLLRSAELPETALRAVLRGMEAVVNEPGGTAWASRLEEAPYAGKTGTSQVVKLKGDADRGKEAALFQHRDHALFIAYAPADKPQLAVAVVVEHGGHGGSVAAPIARAMFTSYFGLELPEAGSETLQVGLETPEEGSEAPVEVLESPDGVSDAPVAPTESGD